MNDRRQRRHEKRQVSKESLQSDSIRAENPKSDPSRIASAGTHRLKPLQILRTDDCADLFVADLRLDYALVIVRKLDLGLLRLLLDQFLICFALAFLSDRFGGDLLTVLLHRDVQRRAVLCSARLEHLGELAEELAGVWFERKTMWIRFGEAS